MISVDTNKKITVIIPIFKVEQYIRNTIQSLISQTNHDFSIILVDDGSPDCSVAIAVEMLANSDLPYKLIKKENEGQGIARNTGFLEAESEWVLFLDSDDVLQPFAVELLCDLAVEYNNVDAIFSKYQSVSQKEIFRLSAKTRELEILGHEILVDSFLKRTRDLLVPGTLYKTDFLKKNKILHKGLRWSEDQCFQWEALNYISEAVYLNCVLYNYLVREGSIMYSAKVEDMINAYEQFKKLPEKMKDERAGKYLVGRWVLGCLHIAARKNDGKAWDILWKKMDAKDHMKALLTFPNLKVRVIAVLGNLNNRILFHVLYR